MFQNVRTACVLIRIPNVPYIYGHIVITNSIRISRAAIYREREVQVVWGFGSVYIPVNLELVWIEAKSWSTCCWALGTVKLPVADENKP